MNERIKELAEQAGVALIKTKGMEDIVDGCYITNDKHLKKFAELIVRECGNIVNSLEQHEGPGDCATVEYIKEHFGVE